MSIDVADWLRGLGLGQYAPAFAANDIDGEVLAELTADDLTGLGITSIGHRRKLLAAIAALRGGAPLPAIETPPRPAAAVGGEAERRQLTVMFCDLVGSTPLSTRFDPEDLREVIAAYHATVAGETARFGGYVARYMGDGALIYFGYPQAHEDDAERAVRAGLALAERVSRLDTLAQLEARIGVASGLVVVGDLIGEGEARQRDVVGETPNLAARLQELAPPGGVVIAEATRRLLGELFECRDLGAVEIRGFDETVPIFQVLRPSAVESRFEALRATRLTALVGRSEELDLLLRHWRRAKAGEGRVVLLSGEAGIGKSRLTAELHERLAGEPHTRLRYFCSPHHQDSALYPVIAQLERAAGFGHEDVAGEKLGKLRALLATGARDNDEIDLLAELLSLPNSTAELNLSPPRKREMLFAALLRQLEVLARNQPVLSVYEDLHWIDPSLRELLDLIVERVSCLSVLLVVTFRPEFEAPWSRLPHVSTLTLNRLDARAGAAMVDNIVGDRMLPSEVAAEIVERTDGIPLFVEELTKAVLEASASGEQIHRTLSGAVSSASAVPPALHASLIARLDRLGPAAREVAQASAAIGREFAYELLAPIVHLDEPSLAGALDRLTGSGLVFQRGTPPRATFLFKHFLVRDAAYATLLRRRRQQLHAAIAGALERNFSSIVTAQPEVLAHHCSEAGLTELAIEYWRRAGERAVRQSANEEAISHLTAGLAQLRQLPDTQSRAKQELALQLAMGQASYAARGFASREATRAFSRARELCAASADDEGIYPTLFGVWLFEYGAAYYADAGRTAVECLARAARTDSASAHIVGHLIAGITNLHLAELVRARENFMAGIGWYRRVSEMEAAQIADKYGVELGAPTYGYASWCLWLLGFPDQAFRLAENAIAIVDRIGHRYTRSRCLSWTAAFDAYRREWSTVEVRAADAIASAQEHGIPMIVAAGRILRAAAQAMLASRENAVAEIREALAAYGATGARFRTTDHLVLLAQALAACGRYGAGLAALREAMTFAEETGERFVEPEIHRLRGDLLLRQTRGSSAEAEECYRKALEVARAQEARAWQLRATVSLARLWGEQGRRAEAHELLAPVYGGFTEGFDTADLKDAKALLAELA